MNPNYLVFLLFCLFPLLVDHQVQSSVLKSGNRGTLILKKLLEDTTRLKNDIEILERLSELVKETNANDENAEKTSPSSPKSDLKEKLGQLLTDQKSGFGKFSPQSSSKIGGSKNVWIPEPVSKPSVEVVGTTKINPRPVSSGDVLKNVERKLIGDLKAGLKQGVSIEDLIKDLKNVKLKGKND